MSDLIIVFFLYFSDSVGENGASGSAGAITKDESLAERRQRHQAAIRQKNSPSSIRRRRRRRRPPILHPPTAPVPPSLVASSVGLCSLKRWQRGSTLASFLYLALATCLLATGCLGQQGGQVPPPNYSVYKMPETNFDCRNKIVGGYYADAQAYCQMFHVCVQVGPNEVSKKIISVLNQRYKSDMCIIIMV